MATGLARMSFSDLQAELRRRQRGVGTLERRRRLLAKKLDALNLRISLLGGSVNGGARRGAGVRRKNAMTLTSTLAKVLKGKTMAVTDAADAVQKAGYRTSSNSFRTQVNIALIKGPFKRVGRGRYTAK